MKRFFTDEQRNEMDDILSKMWKFMESLDKDQIRVYSNFDPQRIAKLAEEMGVENYIQVLRDSELSGYYNPKLPNFVVNPTNTRFISYDDVYELFTILRRFY